MGKTPEEIESVRRASRVAAKVLKEVGKMVAPGVTTEELDKGAEELILREGAVPSFKGYRGYSFATCLSVNNEVVHGLPSPRVLREGDIIGVDIGAKVNGCHGDVAATFPVGKVEDKTLRLLKVTEEALYLAIEKARPGGRVGDVSFAIQRHAEKNGFSVVRELYGHGIGRELHEDPLIPNYGEPGKGVRLRRGMTLAIETMVMAGHHLTKTLPDGWTVVTADGSQAAHFEHTVLITEGKAEILTGESGG